MTNSTPNAPVEQREAIARLIGGFPTHPHDGDDQYVLHDAFPGDYDHRTAKIYELADAILAVRLDEAAIRKDEREKCAKVADTSARLAVEQINRNNAYYERSGSRDAGANDLCRSHQITAEQIASAIRNGGKKP